MAKPKYGDKVLIKTDKEEFKGVLMPTPELSGDITILKLNSGYNIGIDNKRIHKTELVEEYKEEKEKEKAEKIIQKKNLPNISILHTGGTIASKVDYKTGGVIARFTPEELLSMFPELKDIANIKSRLMRNMWSEDMRFAHYNLMAREIEKEIKEGVDGIIITHGTDTMHYSSAALAFILENLPVPVLLVGAQRSSDRGSSDAAVNLIAAAKFIANSDFSEVAICMHEDENDDKCNILPATKTRKMHTSRRDTFRPVNTRPWATIDYRTGQINFFKEDYAKKDTKRELKVRPIREDLKIGILKSHPNLFADEILNYKDFDGLVLEGTGLGHIPISEIDEFTKEHTRIKKAIEDVAKKIIIAMSPQTIYGRVDMNVYAPGRELQEIGVIGNLSDMTPETTFIKLAWLLSNYNKDKVKELMTDNIRGEISKRTEKETFLV